ncbi:MAG: alpha/beta hydrolase [Flavobacteriales bacterium]|nr:MAG: alpha/beta hydrolase [Flavobacteriales bacterium]
MNWLWGALAVSAAAYAGLALFYYLFQERFIFLRFRTSQGYRYRFPTPHTEHRIERPDGARLHALWFKADRPVGTVLYFHGHSGSLKRWGKFASRFTALGHDVLMPDPRGYGKSSGRLSERALIDDAAAWFDWLAERVPPAGIVLYGRSLGSALAVPLAAQRQARMLLLETPFNNLLDVAWAKLPLLPYRWLLRYPFRNDRAIRGVRCPVRIFHGKRDQVVPLACALDLYASIPASVDREAIIFPKGRHNDLYRFIRFREALRRLLEPSA